MQNSSRRGAVGLAIFCLVMLVYGCHGVVVDDLYLPGKHSRGLHLHGKSAWMMFGAMFSAAVYMFSDFLSKEVQYQQTLEFRRFRSITGWIAAALFALALLMALTQKL